METRVKKCTYIINRVLKIDSLSKSDTQVIQIVDNNFGTGIRDIFKFYHLKYPNEFGFDASS